MTSSGKATVTLPTDEQILITREFDAPRHLVYRAWTTPELVKRWWRGKRGKVTVVEIDLRVGGTWRYVMVATAASRSPSTASTARSCPDERIVSTEVYERPRARGSGAEHVTSETDGRTTLSVLVQHASKELVTQSSTPGWSPACRRRWTSWMRSRSRFAELGSASERAHPMSYGVAASSRLAAGSGEPSAAATRSHSHRS